MRLVDSLVTVGSFCQCRPNFFDVLIASCFERDIDDGVTEADAVVGAVVGGLHDIGAGVGEDSCELMQCAGPVGEMNAKAGAASVLDEATLDDTGEQTDVNVTSTDEDGGALSA